MKTFARLALLWPLLGVAQPSTTPPAEPRTVALLAAIGDRIDIVRQREQVGSHLEPYTRKTLQVSSQALNYAVLRGLDRAMSEEEPDTQRVLLQWTMPEDVYAKVSEAIGPERQALVMDALIPHLRGLPQRNDWSRIEVVIPAYTFLQLKGLGTKLAGIGVYVQPLKNQRIELDGLGDMNLSDAAGDYRTINPRTGETGNSSVYMAPYMYFERLSFDAKTLALLKRQRFFDNTKYADPQSTALDVSPQMTTGELLLKLAESVERSAYRSIRETKGEVTSTVPRPVIAPASAASAAER